MKIVPVIACLRNVARHPLNNPVSFLEFSLDFSKQFVVTSVLYLKGWPHTAHL